MIFSENYDKLKTAEAIYNEWVSSKFELKHIDDVINFFGDNMQDVFLEFEKIYNYLITKNTTGKVVKNYSLVKDDSLEGEIVLKEILKNVSGVSKAYLQKDFNLSVSTEPNLFIQLVVGDTKYKIQSVNNALIFSQINPKTSVTKVCYKTYLDGNYYIVQRERIIENKKNYRTFERSNMLIDYNNREITYYQTDKFTYPYNSANYSTKNSTVYVKDGGSGYLTQFTDNELTYCKEFDKNLIYNPNKPENIWLISKPKKSKVDKDVKFNKLNVVKYDLHIHETTDYLGVPELELFKASKNKIC